MNSKTAVSFWRCFNELPESVQRLAYKSYEMWLINPHHPSLRFKRFTGQQWSVRIGDHYRAVGYFHDSDTFIWTWIGTHEPYNKF